MKIAGLMLILLGGLSIALMFSGLIVWTIPVAEEATPGSLAGTINVKLLALSGLGGFCIVAGSTLIIRSIAKSRAVTQND